MNAQPKLKLVEPVEDLLRRHLAERGEGGAMPLRGRSAVPSGSSQSSLSRPKAAAAIARGLPIVRTAKAAGDHEMINPALREWLAR